CAGAAKAPAATSVARSTNTGERHRVLDNGPSVLSMPLPFPGGRRPVHRDRVIRVVAGLHLVLQPRRFEIHVARVDQRLRLPGLVLSRRPGRWNHQDLVATLEDAVVGTVGAELKGAVRLNVGPRARGPGRIDRGKDDHAARQRLAVLEYDLALD